MGPVAARAYVGFGLATIAVYFAIGGSNGIYEGLGLAAVGAIAIGAAYHRPANWRGWAVLAVAQAFLVAGDVTYDAFPPATFPGLPDLFYVVGYVLLVAGLVLLMGRSFDWRDLASDVDAVLITLALGLSAWFLFVEGVFTVEFALGPLVALALPVIDIVCLGLLIRIALTPGRRPAAYWLVLAGFLPLVVADASYVVPALGDAYYVGSWLDAGWLLFYVFLGAAALHPSMAGFARSEADRAAPPVRRVVVASAALLLLPVAVLVQHLVHGHADPTLIAVGGTLILVGMLGRAVMLVRELDEMRARAERSEQRFRMVFERAPVGISVGRNGVMSETNPALQRLLGYTGEELAGMRYTEVTRPDVLSSAVQAELDAGLRESFAIEKQYIRKDGTPIDTRVYVSLGLGGGLGMSIVEDVTEQRALAEQLIQAQKMEAVGKLAGGIAHDFNNLMTAVLGYSELLLQGSPPGDVRREKLEAIRDAATRASDLTRQLLAFSRRQVMQVDDIDLRDVVSDMDVLLRRLIGEDVRLEKILGDEPVIVRADRTQLEQVVLNLAVNAREAMPGGGTLSVTVRSDHGNAILTVADTGSGMDEATQARIFDPFFTTKEIGQGSGLGLSTVHGIVGQSGGTIEVESEPGRGTVFRISLPEAERQWLPAGPRRASVVD